MTTFDPYLAEISPTGIRVREPYGWQQVETLDLPDGYRIVHETDADTERFVSGWGWGLFGMAMVLGLAILGGIWQWGHGA